MNPQHLVLAASLLFVPSFAHAAEPILGTFTFDPVALVRDGKQMPGKKEFAVEHANFRYLFASKATQDTFRAKPSAFEIQLGGACGRMGSLSGTGKTDLFTVHKGRLYIFASTICRGTFLRDPSKVLEPPIDPSIKPATKESQQRGKELVALAVKWLGGAKRLDAAVLRIHRERTVKHEGKDHQAGDALVIAPGGRLRQESSWDDRKWVQVLSPQDAFFVEPKTGVRTMQPVQRRSMIRKLQRDVLALLQYRNRKDFSAASAGRSKDGATEIVNVRHAGFNHVLTINPKTGEIHSHAFTGWTPRMAIANVERNFTRWQTYSGLRVPVEWKNQYDGQAGDPTNRLAGGFQVEVVPKAAADLFVRPK